MLHSVFPLEPTDEEKRVKPVPNEAYMHDQFLFHICSTPKVLNNEMIICLVKKTSDKYCANRTQCVHKERWIL